MIFPLFLASPVLGFKLQPQESWDAHKCLWLSLFQFKTCHFLFFHFLPYYRARPAGQTDSAVLQIAILKSVFQIVDQRFSALPIWLRDNCADKPLGIVCRVSEMKSPLLLSSGISFKLVWPGHRKCRQRKNNSVATEDIYSEPVAPTQAALMCIVPSAGS